MQHLLRNVEREGRCLVTHSSEVLERIEEIGTCEGYLPKDWKTQRLGQKQRQGF